MLTNFEVITAELSQEEKTILPWLISGFRKRTKDNPIKAPEIVHAMNNYIQQQGEKLRFTEVRLRKMVNYIRSNSLLPLIATSEGYYCSHDREEIAKQITSLEERARSILSCSVGLKKYLEDGD